MSPRSETQPLSLTESRGQWLVPPRVGITQGHGRPGAACPQSAPWSVWPGLPGIHQDLRTLREPFQLYPAFSRTADEMQG